MKSAFQTLAGNTEHALVMTTSMQIEEIRDQGLAHEGGKEQEPEVVHSGCSHIFTKHILVSL